MLYMMICSRVLNSACIRFYSHFFRRLAFEFGKTSANFGKSSSENAFSQTAAPVSWRRLRARGQLRVLVHVDAVEVHPAVRLRISVSPLFARCARKRPPLGTAKSWQLLAEFHFSFTVQSQRNLGELLHRGLHGAAGATPARARPSARRSGSRLRNFAGLVLGCIETKFCK